MLVRAKIDEEDLGKGKMAIIVNELPYQVNKANLVEKIAAS
jgi:DNA gyrase subunit A